MNQDPLILQQTVNMQIYDNCTLMLEKMPHAIYNADIVFDLYFR